MKKAAKDRTKTIWLIFTATLLISAAIVTGIMIHSRQLALEHGQYLLGSKTGKVQYSIDSRILNLQILEMIVTTNNGSVTDFDEVAASLCKDDPAVRSLQLSPDGVVSYIYPTEAGENNPSLDLFDDPNRKEAAEYSRDSGNMTMTGSLDPENGETNVVIRRPIYLTGEDGTQTFWVFSSALLDVSYLFDKAKLADLEKDGYSYQIWKYNNDKTEKLVLSGSSRALSDDALSAELEVPGENWYFSLMPAHGWITASQIATHSFIAFVIDILITFLVFYFIRSEDQKRELDALANLDPLTGLYNNRYFSATLTKLSEEGQPFLLFFLDMNRFKQVNDTYGHKAGDALLMEASKRLQQCLRDEDYAFRIGGDEFSLIVPQNDSAPSGDALIASIKENIQKPLQIDDITLYMGTSCGYAAYPSESTDTEALIKIADERMYQDKEAAHRADSTAVRL